MKCILKPSTSYRKKNGAVRSVDVGETMHVSKPSVSRAVGILKKEGYLRSDADGHLLLSESGHAIAKKNIRPSHYLVCISDQAGGPPRDCRSRCL